MIVYQYHYFCQQQDKFIAIYWIFFINNDSSSNLSNELHLSNAVMLQRECHGYITFINLGKYRYIA